MKYFEGFNVFLKFDCILFKCVKVFEENESVDWLLGEVFVFVMILRDGMLICIIG